MKCLVDNNPVTIYYNNIISVTEMFTTSGMANITANIEFLYFVSGVNIIGPGLDTVRGAVAVGPFALANGPIRFGEWPHNVT